MYSKKIASLDKVDLSNKQSFFTKLKEYPYEFEINSSLQLASIDGIQIGTSEPGDGGNIDNSELKALIQALSQKVTNLENNLQEANNKISTLENETIVNKIIGLI